MGDGGRDSPPGRGMRVLVVFWFVLFVLFLALLSLSFLSLFCKGSSYPETCAQRTAEGEGFLMLK
jgi:hypothetical protein